MSNVILHDLVMKRESKTFTDSLYAILTAAGLFTGPKYMLSALSGMAFIFTVHERLRPHSVTAYGQWGTVHKRAADSLGIFTVTDAGRTRHPTFQSYQQDAVQWIKSSLDQGIGAIYWIPEFGVIYGYDDEDRVFYVQDGNSGENGIVLYDNFGLNFTPFWYAQIFGGKVKIPAEDMVLEAIRMALDDWENPYSVLPDRSIASGRMAYTYLIQALEQGDYDAYGAVYILDSYRVSRREIMQFLREAGLLFPELKEALTMYEQLADLSTGLKSWISCDTENRVINRSDIPSLVEMLTEAKGLEEHAMRTFRSISGRYPDLNRSTVPRWGLSSAR
ncbi:hypothetical protein P4H66_12800 [Paenibacillus dokdonensis]|uniref:Uncharacterized protein n=1 Tax=Paenibacillus dokdonensis TaxID=2567944 RepID=A0ABU6GRE9_9BACL|nr:hypothetical protein [Paenibacillus dokdonensis]MEC0240727.1 hypothetical protein [Paenibacillus dokdonensis]